VLCICCNKKFTDIFFIVSDAISILRGLKERYETHHGVRIQDAALVEACQLADRYITARKLPDKAIDLVDEACASVRMFVSVNTYICVCTYMDIYIHICIYICLYMYM